MGDAVEHCRMCNRPRDNHTGVRHMFTPPDTPVDTSQFILKRLNGAAQENTPGSVPEMRMTTMNTPFDPVLRQALITKGIITPDDLIEAGRMIAALTRQVVGGDPS